MGHLQDRLSNIREIFRNLRFGNPNIEMNSQFDYIFLLGDLNFRLDVNRISKKQGFPTTFCFDYVINQIEKKNFKELFQYDQLHNCQMEEGHLSGFKEGTYNFAPTFKVLKDVFGMEYNKKRIPSYCDRILWKSIHSNDDDNIEKEDRSRSDSAKMIRKKMSILRMEEEEGRRIVVIIISMVVVSNSYYLKAVNMLHLPIINQSVLYLTLIYLKK